MASLDELNSFLNKTVGRTFSAMTDAALKLVKPYDLSDLHTDEVRTLVGQSLYSGTTSAHALRTALIGDVQIYGQEMFDRRINASDIQHGFIAVTGRMSDRFGLGYSSERFSAFFVPCDCWPT